MEENLKTYSDQKIISYYERYHDLQKPEKTILEILNPMIGSFEMLDIGIGGGRTTSYFAPIVKKYVGVDYSDGMTRASSTKYSNKFSNAKFYTVDVRKMSQFRDSEFDFALFSFNGLDTLTLEDRALGIEEVKRVLKKGGLFCFSSHNIQTLDIMFKFKFRYNLFALVKRMLDLAKIKRLNASELAVAKTLDFVRINDGAHNFSLKNSYIRPIAQVKILEQAGFEMIRAFSLDSGAELSTGQLGICTDKWIYYLCQKT